LLWQRFPFTPMLASAAMMKAGYLTLFWLMGYQMLRNPLVQLVRKRLAGAFALRNQPDAIGSSFAEFENAYSIIEMGDRTQPSIRTPLPFNTIDSMQVVELVRNHIGFAFNFIFDVGGDTIMGSFPYTRDPKNADVAWQLYCDHLAGTASGDLRAIVVKWDGGLWQPQGLLPYVEAFSPVAHASRLARNLLHP
ncbi:MAG TPA: hypothetical protein VF624_11050, partial [Tepidisphaeraceae bacterium]